LNNEKGDGMEAGDDLTDEYSGCGDVLPDEDMAEADDAVAGEEEIEGAETGETYAGYSLDGYAVPPETPVYQLRVSCSNETIYAVYNGGASNPDIESELMHGTMALVPTRYGMDLARITGKICGRMRQNISKVVRIERIASAADLEREKNHKLKEEEAFRICKQKIAERRMEMKLIAVHYLLDESKILFFFTAENRIDFRELVKDLVFIFKIRIELRQIGIRDEARMTGGLAACGRMFCCHSISDKLKPVAIRMAKDQGLSLNSMKISGPCGRLLCCLAYEQNFYAEQRRCLPNEGTKIMSDGSPWKVTEVNPLSGKITLVAEDGRRLRLPIEKLEKNGNIWTING
jgi:cell fate regulator YaaT (PSP1 superfamily)